MQPEGCGPSVRPFFIRALPAKQYPRKAGSRSGMPAEGVSSLRLLGEFLLTFVLAFGQD